MFSLQAAAIVVRYGLKTLRRSLTQGQYEIDHGLFFGGKRPQPTTLLVQQKFVEWTANAPRVLHLDFHTGLGRFAACSLLTDEPSGSPGYAALVATFAPHPVETIGRGLASRDSARGSMGHWLHETLASRGVDYVFVNPEFGTYSGFRVFRDLREENRFHRYPGAPGYTASKSHFLEAFRPRDERWQSAVVQTGLDLIERGVHGLGAVLRHG